MADKSLDFENYRKYSSDPNPTTNADLQDYMSNQNKLTTELTEQFLWQPLTAYAVGDIVHSKNIEGGKVARCTQAGTTGSEEPQWSAVTTDGTCKWELTAESITATQRAAMDSGITAAKVSQYDGYATSKQNVLSTAQMNAVNSGVTATKVATYDGYATSIPTAVKGATDFNAGEKFYNAGSSGSISLANGPVQICSASSITLPTVQNGYTLMISCTYSGAVTWNGNIKWAGGTAPDFDLGDNVCVFTGVGGYWLGNYNGGYR